jgi:ribulose-5-phosphate 4-epimerase/fuculose-1-phosphate aldolase
MTRLGYITTSSGQLSVRNTLDPSTFWINGLGVSYWKITPEDLNLVNTSGEVIESNSAVNFAAQYLHSAIYQARPDINSIAHFHTDHSVVWSALDLPLGIVSQEASVFYNDLVQYSHNSKFSEMKQEAIDIAATLGSCSSILLKNHGAITTGISIEAAAYRTVLLDKVCQLNILARSTGTVPNELDDNTAKELYKFFNRSAVMKYQFDFFKEHHGQ